MDRGHRGLGSAAGRHERRGQLPQAPSVWTVVLTLTAVLAAVTAIGALGGCGQSATKATSAAAPSASSPTTGADTATRPHTTAPPENSPTAPGRPDEAPPSATMGSARRALAALAVKGRAPKTGYSRERFGHGWSTVNGCDTRDRMLRRDLIRRIFAAGDTCAVQRGRLNDPFTAAAITFVRGGSSDVEIDHVVALGDAWQKGAQQWSRGRRVQFANDPLNLLSVDGSANSQKGDGDAATWLPPNKAFRCRYVARQVAVKRKYHAWVTRAEHDAIARILARCPRQPLPRNGRQRVHIVPTHRAPRQQSAPEATPAPPGRARVFENCDAVRAAGLAPLRRGTPEYDANRHLDRDGDGLACE
jgi:hypothetical protein